MAETYNWKTGSANNELLAFIIGQAAVAANNQTLREADKTAVSVVFQVNGVDLNIVPIFAIVQRDFSRLAERHAQAVLKSLYGGAHEKIEETFKEMTEALHAAIPGMGKVIDVEVVSTTTNG